ncbi:MAG: hypothetical protein ACLPYZ_09770 [Limisphaerales bacterium]
MPIAFYCNRERSAPGIVLGAPGGGAAFADFSILTGFTRRFGSDKKRTGDAFLLERVLERCKFTFDKQPEENSNQAIQPNVEGRP